MDPMPRPLNQSSYQPNIYQAYGREKIDVKLPHCKMCQAFWLTLTQGHSLFGSLQEATLAVLKFWGVEDDNGQGSGFPRELNLFLIRLVAISVVGCVPVNTNWVA